MVSGVTISNMIDGVTLWDMDVDRIIGEQLSGIFFPVGFVDR